MAAAQPHSSAPTRDQVAGTLASASGLNQQVAYNWLAAENSQVGHGTNPLGILCGNSKGSGLEIGCAGRFAVYASVWDGAKAAAWLLLHGSHYGGVRAAIASGSPAQQRAAIVNSGWAAGNYGGGAGFSAGNLPHDPNATYPGVGGSTGGGSFAAAGSTPAAMPALNIANGHVLSAGDVLYITQALTSAGWFPGWGGAHSAGAAYLNGLVGQAWSPDLSAQIAAHFQASQASGAGAVPLVDSTFAAIAALPGQLVGYVAPVAILVGLLWIGKVGLQKTLG